MSIVETSFGRLRGQVTSGVHAFRGIPFAQPPLGDLALAGARTASSLGRRA